jgi:cellulose synthase/poly-beta-1,6-N-acetylglucosamine synthase-like glycosyltransferase
MALGVGAEAQLPRPQAYFGALAGDHFTSSPTDGLRRPFFAELDCVRGMIADEAIDAAETRAAQLGVGADRVLIATGAINEETYLRALGASLGVPFEPLDHVTRAMCPLTDARLIDSAAQGMLPLVIDGGLRLVVAPRLLAARRIGCLIDHDPHLARLFCFTTNERLLRLAMRHAGKTIVGRASTWLAQTWPALSAAPPRWRGGFVPLIVVGSVLLGIAMLATTVAAYAAEILLAAAFLAWVGLRLAAAFVDGPPPRRARRLPDEQLPTYTVIAALYREAKSVDGLLAAFERLDYPREKLDVLVAVEADDRETLAALAARKSRLPITIVPVPPSQPRTKPKALNVALAFARGAFTVVYDAEDRPEPDQLREALWAFAAGGRCLACVQARLCIDNIADSLLTRFFAAEYAGQFDVFLPGLAALRLPLPLGGSSNHFRTEILRRVGGWDAFNVTEDADLGLRLARFGYRTQVIFSTTYEEAPAKLGPWLRQRTRWFKGWMQTWLVHMRAPARLIADLGAAGFADVQLLAGGNALAALVHPLFLTGLVYSIARGIPIWQAETFSLAVLATLCGATVVVGYLASIFLGWLGLVRRGLRDIAWVLAFTPLHWLLLSAAAWRAFVHLVVSPYAWEKTEHGLAKTSRLRHRSKRPSSQFGRRSGRCPKQPAPPGCSATCTCADPRPLRPAAVSG